MHVNDVRRPLGRLQEQTMKSIISKIIVGAAGLMLATAPLAASAQSWQGHGSTNRGGYTQRGGSGYQRGSSGYQRGGGYARGGGYDRGGWGGGVHVNVGYSQPVYQPPYDDGYYGWAPGGFQGYFWNGNWYHHRRWNGGVWIYF
jgi:hypothetical protein